MKEEIIKSVLELNDGDCVLVDSFKGDIFGCVSNTFPSIRYSFTDKNGRKHRSLGLDSNNKLIIVYADDEGCTGDETIKTVGFITENGSLTIDEDTDLTDWVIKKIDINHPKYNKTVVKSANMMSSIMNKIGPMF